MVAMLLIKTSELEGILWRLLRKADSGEGIAWIMQVLPRLSWLLAAGESWYCNGLALEGPPAVQLQLPLASWIQVGNHLIALLFFTAAQCLKCGQHRACNEHHDDV